MSKDHARALRTATIAVLVARVQRAPDLWITAYDGVRSRVAAILGVHGDEGGAYVLNLEAAGGSELTVSLDYTCDSDPDATTEDIGLHLFPRHCAHDAVLVTDHILSWVRSHHRVRVATEPDDDDLAAVIDAAVALHTRHGDPDDLLSQYQQEVTARAASLGPEQRSDPAAYDGRNPLAALIDTAVDLFRRCDPDDDTLTPRQKVLVARFTTIFDGAESDASADLLALALQATGAGVAVLDRQRFGTHLDGNPWTVLDDPTWERIARDLGDFEDYLTGRGVIGDYARLVHARNGGTDPSTPDRKE